ncbi:MAG TPA: DNA repair protein RecO, partial [bacterium]|nr:DNA repair protein RecO [bacterium]
FRETSVILDLLSMKLGKIRGVLKGVRKPKSRVAPLAFHPGSYIFVFVYPRSRGGLMLLHAPQLVQAFPMAGAKRSAIWQLMLRLVNLFLPEQEKCQEVVRALLESGQMMMGKVSPEVVYVWFKMKMVRLLGYGLELNRCLLCRRQGKLGFISGRLGGVLCDRCLPRDRRAVRISRAVLGVMRYLERTPAERLEVIKKIPAEILEKTNFFLNLVLQYHAEAGYIWWQDERNIFAGSN